MIRLRSAQEVKSLLSEKCCFVALAMTVKSELSEAISRSEASKSVPSLRSD